MRIRVVLEAESESERRLLRDVYCHECLGEEFGRLRPVTSRGRLYATATVAKSVDLTRDLRRRVNSERAMWRAVIRSVRRAR